MTAPHNPSDRSFSADVSRFEKNIYHTAKGRIREAVLAADLAGLIALPGPLKVLDIGAGLGQINQLFAAAGHQVTHTDIAPEMVAQAQAVHQQAGLAGQYQYYAVGLQGLAQSLAGQQFDVILCHAVLEWLAQPERALAQIKPLMAERGWLSLMFYNRDAKEMANLIYGNFDYVRAGLKVKKKVRFSPQQPLQIEQVRNWTLAHNLTLYKHSGVRCIHDYLRVTEHQQRDDLIAMELAYRQREPFRQLGRYQHFLLRTGV
ncbi:MAG: methyltransferase domain-containing protein [Idiomarina sp.]|nr:methyltransferase domain-containing protein [Idiomarina sp.]